MSSAAAPGTSGTAEGMAEEEEYDKGSKRPRSHLRLIHGPSYASAWQTSKAAPGEGSVFGHISQTHEVYCNPDIQIATKDTRAPPTRRPKSQQALPSPLRIASRGYLAPRSPSSFQRFAKDSGAINVSSQRTPQVAKMREIGARHGDKSPAQARANHSPGDSAHRLMSSGLIVRADTEIQKERERDTESVCLGPVSGSAPAGPARTISALGGGVLPDAQDASPDAEKVETDVGWDARAILHNLIEQRVHRPGSISYRSAIRIAQEAANEGAAGERTVAMLDMSDDHSLVPRASHSLAGGLIPIESVYAFYCNPRTEAYGLNSTLLGMLNSRGAYWSEEPASRRYHVPIKRKGVLPEPEPEITLVVHGEFLDGVEETLESTSKSMKHIGGLPATKFKNRYFSLPMTPSSVEEQAQLDELFENRLGFFFSGHQGQNTGEKLVLVSSHAVKSDGKTFQTEVALHMVKLLPQVYQDNLKSIMDKMIPSSIQIWGNGNMGRGGIQGNAHSDAPQTSPKVCRVVMTILGPSTATSVTKFLQCSQEAKRNPALTLSMRGVKDDVHHRSVFGLGVDQHVNARAMISAGANNRAVQEAHAANARRYHPVTPFRWGVDAPGVSIQPKMHKAKRKAKRKKPMEEEEEEQKKDTEDQRLKKEEKEKERLEERDRLSQYFGNLDKQEEAAYNFFAAAKRVEAAKECSGVTGIADISAAAITQRLRFKWTDLPLQERLRQVAEVQALEEQRHKVDQELTAAEQAAERAARKATSYAWLVRWAAQGNGEVGAEQEPPANVVSKLSREAEKTNEIQQEMQAQQVRDRARDAQEKKLEEQWQKALHAAEDKAQELHRSNVLKIRELERERDGLLLDKTQRQEQQARELDLQHQCDGFRAQVSGFCTYA